MPSGALAAAAGTSIFTQPEKQCVVSPEHPGDVATMESWEAGFRPPRWRLFTKKSGVGSCPGAVSLSLLGQSLHTPTVHPPAVVLAQGGSKLVALSLVVLSSTVQDTSRLSPSVLRTHSCVTSLTSLPGARAFQGATPKEERSCPSRAPFTS